MERVLDQPERRAAAGFQRVPQHHGAEASVCLGEREPQQIKVGRIRCRFPGQSIAAAVEQVLHRAAYGSDPGGKLHRGHGRQQIRLRLGWCGADTCVAADLDVPGKQLGRTDQADCPEAEHGNRS